MKTLIAVVTWLEPIPNTGRQKRNCKDPEFKSEAPPRDKMVFVSGTIEMECV